MLLDGLNVPQLQAVTTRSQAVLVIAGAGSGKTRVLTSRIAYLVNDRMESPHNILALTFTRKAAQEMKERLASLLDASTARKVWVGTFHAISLRILEMHGSKLGYSSQISVYDEIDQADIIQAIIGELGLKEVKVKHVVDQLQGYAADCDAFQFGGEIRTIVTEYRRRLKSFNAVDYTLLLTETLELIRRFPDIFDHYHSKFKHVLIDEYQDTDRTQYYLHEAIKPDNMFVVGDLDQAIYGWRGSDIEIIRDFEKFHPGAEIIKLEQSYRCPSNIVASANNLIAHNTERYDKVLWTENAEGVQSFQAAADPKQEGEWIAGMVDGMNNVDEVAYKDIAILIRTHRQAEAITRALDERLVPYKLVGSQVDFWKGTEIRDVLSILQVLHNRKNSFHFRRVARRVIYRLTDREWLEYETEALRLGRRVVDLIIDSRSGPLVDLIAWFNENREKHLSLVIHEVYKHIDIVKHYVDQSLIHKAMNLEAIFEQSTEWEAQNEAHPTVENFLMWLAERDAQMEVDDTDTVKIMTIHAAKGLEFPVVFLAGMTEGKLPHQRAVRANDVEEERRLCYVAITRTKGRLFLSFPTQEPVGTKMLSVQRSRFIQEMTP
jgi:DNA helicase-2/ATP-dependent DNA helicase PcrA